MKHIYLAGPDVFLPDAATHGERLKAHCATHGYIGHFPLDNQVEAATPHIMAERIRLANIDLIHQCDIVLANLSPFRGPEPDSGTVWEVGYAMAHGKIVVGYSSNMLTLREKTRQILDLPSEERDHDDLHIEDFGLTHNLMYAHCVMASDFEEALKRLKTLLKQ